MSVSADQFGRIVMKWTEETVPKAANQHLRAVTLELFKRIVLASPVDKGLFRSNWNLAVDAYPEGFFGSSWEGGEEAAKGPATRHALANGMRVLESMRALDTLKAGIPSFIGIGNSMPYGPRLEYEPGFTKKAEAGFVRAAVSSMESWLQAGAP